LKVDIAGVPEIFVGDTVAMMAMVLASSSSCVPRREHKIDMAAEQRAPL
jgi:hypothetical protein